MSKATELLNIVEADDKYSKIHKEAQDIHNELKNLHSAAKALHTKLKANVKAVNSVAGNDMSRLHAPDKVLNKHQNILDKISDLHSTLDNMGDVIMGDKK